MNRIGFKYAVTDYSYNFFIKSHNFAIDLIILYDSERIVRKIHK